MPERRERDRMSALEEAYEEYRVTSLVPKRFNNKGAEINAAKISGFSSSALD